MAGRQLGWGSTATHRRLTGESPIDAEHLFEIAELLDVPVERFFPQRRRPGNGRIIGPRLSPGSRLVALAC